MHTYYVYIMSSKSRVLYVGITNDIRHRVWQHQHDELPSFTNKYRVHRLVYLEWFQYVHGAIEREKSIKGWLRERKIALIEVENPTWEDLSEAWFKKQILRSAQDDSSNGFGSSNKKSGPGFKMNFTTLQLAFDSGIATLTLNRPDKRNAISYELILDLLRALEEVKNSSAQVLILTGAGKAFCSGMDLNNLKALTSRTPEQTLDDSRKMASLFRSLYDFPKPTIAAVNGPAVAGGTGLATLCDFTLAVPEAKFGYTEVRIGFVPAIVSSFLIANIGEKRARDLLLTGRIFGADEALRLGLVNEIVPPEQLMSRAQELAAQLLENSPASLQATKKLLSSYTRDQLDRQVAQAVQSNSAIRQTADFKEGITAFLEKRKPTWTGK